MKVNDSKQTLPCGRTLLCYFSANPRAPFPHAGLRVRFGQSSPSGAFRVTVWLTRKQVMFEEGGRRMVCPCNQEPVAMRWPDGHSLV